MPLGWKAGDVTRRSTDYSEAFRMVGLDAEPNGHGNDHASQLSGSELLRSLAAYVRRYVVLTDEQADLIALWIVHTYTLEVADTTPYLEVVSAEKRSGKTRLLEVLDTVVARPWFTGRVTAAVLVRKVADQSATLLLDESDTAFKGDREYAEALRGILNTGFRRGGVASLCVLVREPTSAMPTLPPSVRRLSRGSGSCRTRSPTAVSAPS